MPRIHLKPQFVANPPRPTDKPKIDYFDTALSGFMLEVCQTGTATYYIRYRDKGGYIRQIKIGTPDTMSGAGTQKRLHPDQSRSVRPPLPIFYGFRHHRITGVC